jgi:nitrate/nitrite transporter NarK
MFYRASNAVIAPQLQRDLSLTSESLGMLSASFFYAFAITQIPLALLLDRLGARMIMTVLTLVGSLGSCVFGLSGGLHGAVLGRVLLGLGMAGNLMGGMKLFTQWYSSRDFATLSGLLVGAGALGTIAASTPLALLAGLIGWRWSFIAIGICTAGLGIFFCAKVQDAPYQADASAARSPRDRGTADRLKILFLSSDYWLISCGTFFRYGTLMAIQGLWAGPYLMECFGLTPVQAGNIIMLTTIGYVVGGSGGGWLSDRVLHSRKYVVILGIGGMAVVALMLTYGWGQCDVLLRACTFLFLGFFSGCANVVYAHIKGIMPPEMSGMAMTGINFFTMLGVGAYIHVMGWVLDHLPAGKQAGIEGYQTAFFLILAGLSGAAVLYLFTHDSKEFEKK